LNPVPEKIGPSCDVGVHNQKGVRIAERKKDERLGIGEII